MIIKQRKNMKNSPKEIIPPPLGLRRQVTLSGLSLFEDHSSKAINCALTTEVCTFINKFYVSNDHYQASLDIISHAIKDHKHDLCKVSQQCCNALISLQDASVFEKLSKENGIGNFLVLGKAIEKFIQSQEESSAQCKM